MLTAFLLFAVALGWCSMLAQGFQPKIAIAKHRPHATTEASAAGRIHPLDWHLNLGASSQGTTNDTDNGEGSITRRSAIAAAATVATSGLLSCFPSAASAAQPNGLILSTAPASGLRWADAKVGSGEIPSKGSFTSIDYSMASTAGRFPSIYSTKNGDAPYRWKLGDGSTIRGIELAVLGDASEGIPPMRPGGIRRVIVPNNLGYNALIGRDDSNVVLRKNSNNSNKQGDLSPAGKNQRCLPGAEGSLGPIPPKDATDGAYQRWYQFYCNPRIPYQPDLVLDIKLYGKRGARTATASVSAASL